MTKKTNAQKRFNHTKLISFAMMAFLFALLSPGTGVTQSNRPISKKGLIDTLRTNVVPTDRLVQEIERRGVNFQLTSQDESELRAAGARPELIEAVRQNFRAGATPASGGGSASTTGGASGPAKTNANVPPGPPLSKNEVITMLQSGVAVARVEQFVEARGVSFAITPAIAREIKAAGGNNSLIGAITARATSGPNTSSGPARPPEDSGPNYDDLTDRAIAAMQANDPNFAVQLLQQAIRLDASQPTAYALLGFAELYGKKDIVSAERAMRAAVERGGGAAFRAYHDHDGFFNQYCQGSFFVTKSGVSFKADDGNHTFEAKDSEIKEAKLNGFVGSQLGAFHVKVIQSNGKSKNYNFAPATTSKAESNLIINLISGYQ